MSSAAVSIEATYGDRQTLDALANLIGKRASILGETSGQSVTATSILILKSIRARTRVANPDEAAGVLVARRPNLFPSFMRQGGSNILCIRHGGPRGPRYTGSWYCTKRDRINRNTAAVYFVHDVVSKDKIGTDAKTYLIIADSEQEARDWGIAKHKRRVARYSGLAKNMFSSLMNKASEDSVVQSSANNLITSVINREGFVLKQQYGFNSGSFSITIVDNLNYAMLAIDGGASTVNLAMQKAANTTAARINRIAGLPFDQQIETPFPEIAHK